MSSSGKMVACFDITRLDQISKFFCHSQVMAIFSVQMTLPEMEKVKIRTLDLFLQLQQTSATVFFFTSLRLGPENV